MARPETKSLFTAELIVPAIGAAFRKLNPRALIRNPVMFTTAVVATLLTLLLVVGQDGLATGFKLQLVVWLWLTVLFGTFAEALAEGRGKAQAASLRAAKAELSAKRLNEGGSSWENIPASALKFGDIVLVETGDLIPSDGEVVAGVASVNEAAITGESAPVIREAGGDRSAVTAGTRVISDEIRVRVTVNPGQGFLDRMIALGTIPAFASYAGGAIPVAILAALLITLIPTTIAALLSAIGIAGMDRLVRFNVLAKSGRAVEAAGGVGALLLRKTGPVTVGDPQKGAVDSVLKANTGAGATAAATELRRITDEIARAGGTPLAVARDGQLLGAIFLKDIVKAGIRSEEHKSEL